MQRHCGRQLLYNAAHAEQVGRWVHKAVVRSFEEEAAPGWVVVTPSHRFHGTDFLETYVELRDLNAMFADKGWDRIVLETCTLERVRGSGFLVDKDQVYDMEACMIRWG